MNKQNNNMRCLLGYLNQSEWLYLLNIGNIMQITPLTVHDLYSSTSCELELTRDSILEKVPFLLSFLTYTIDKFPGSFLLLYVHRASFSGLNKGRPLNKPTP